MKAPRGVGRWTRAAGEVVGHLELFGIGSIFHPPGSARTISGSPKWYDIPANWGMDD